MLRTDQETNPNVNSTRMEAFSSQRSGLLELKSPLHLDQDQKSEFPLDKYLFLLQNWKQKRWNFLSVKNSREKNNAKQFW